MRISTKFLIVLSSLFLVVAGVLSWHVIGVVDDVAMGRAADISGRRCGEIALVFEETLARTASMLSVEISDSAWPIAAETQDHAYIRARLRQLRDSQTDIADALFIDESGLVLHSIRRSSQNLRLSDKDSWNEAWKAPRTAVIGRTAEWRPDGYPGLDILIAITTSQGDVLGGLMLDYNLHSFGLSRKLILSSDHLVFLLDEDGAILASSAGFRRNEPLVLEDHKKRQGSFIEDPPGGNGLYMASLSRLESLPFSVAYLVPVDAVWDTAVGITMRLTQGFGILFVILVLAIFILDRWIIRKPLKSLEPEQYANVGSGHEIEELVGWLNAMDVSLADRDRFILRQGNEMDDVLNILSSHYIIADRSGCILRSGPKNQPDSPGPGYEPIQLAEDTPGQRYQSNPVSEAFNSLLNGNDSRVQRSGPMPGSDGSEVLCTVTASWVKGDENEVFILIVEGDPGGSSTDFLGSLCHELRTPLGVVAGFGQLVREEGLSGEQNTFMDGIETAVRTMDGLIGEVQDYARVAGGRLSLNAEPVLVEDLLRFLESRYAAEAKEKNLELKLSSEGHPMFLADRAVLLRILSVLVENALQYTTQGKVDVKLRNTNSLIIIVEDTGVGIPASMQEAIFKPLIWGRDRQTGTEGKGFGLGLAIVREIVSLWKGDLDLLSAEGSGSLFTVSLPPLN